MVLSGGMALNTGKIQSFGIHMDIKGSIRGDQGRVEITMFDTVTTTAVEVTGPTGGPAAGADMKGYFLEIDRFKNFVAKFLFL